MTEKTIAKFKYEKNNYKLLEITIKNGGWDNEARTYFDTFQYLIVKNRKRLAWTRWEGVAKQKFANLIAGELLQTKIQL